MPWCSTPFKTDNPLMLFPIVAALFRKVNPQSQKERP